MPPLPRAQLLAPTVQAALVEYITDASVMMAEFFG